MWNKASNVDGVKEAYYYYCSKCDWIIITRRCIICDSHADSCLVFYPSKVRIWNEQEMHICRRRGLLD